MESAESLQQNDPGDAPHSDGAMRGGERPSAPSTEYFPVRRSREEQAAYLSAHGREDEAFYRDEE